MIQRLSTASLTRSTALRGLAASVATLTGVRLTALPGVARKHNNNKKHEPKRRVCHCGRNNPQRVGCTTKRLPKEKVKQHLKRHKDDYKGQCVTPPTPSTCVGQSGACSADAQCCAGLFCADNITCQPLGSCREQTVDCIGDTQCCSGLCNVGGGGRTGDTCTTCRTARADCMPGAGNGCCSGLICSATVPDNENRCCVDNGNPAPGGCPAGGTDRRCCSGTCDFVSGLCT